MIQLWRAELRKIMSLKGVWVLLVLSAAFVFFVNYQSWRNQSGMARETSLYERTLSSLSKNPQGNWCETSRGEGRPCRPKELQQMIAQIRGQLVFNETFLETGRDGDSMMGGITVALGLLGTAVGVGVASLLGVTSLSMEYTYGTMRTVILREPSRVRVIVAKFITCLSIMLAFSVTLAAALALASSLVGLRLGSGSGVSAPWGSLHLQSPVTMFATVLIVTWLFTAIGIFGTVATKSALGGVGFVFALVIADRIISTGVPALSRWTLSYNVASLENALQTSAFTKSTTTELWTLLFPKAPVGYLSAFTSIVGIALLFTLGSLAVARRREA